MTERAIRRIKKLRLIGMEVNGGLEYYLLLEQEITKIVNNF